MKKNYFFLFVGLCLFIFSTYTAIQTQIEQKSIERTIGLISSFNADPNEASKAYPVISFDLPDGRHFEFTSPYSYPQKKYRLNETVSIYYPSNTPEKAYLGSFSMRWVGLLVLELISLIMVIFFAGKTIKQRTMQKLLERLRTEGTPLSTRPLRVEILYRTKKGDARCSIISVWKDEDGVFHEFKTEAIEQEPENLLERYRHHTIIVYINPKNQDDYVVDMSFLALEKSN